MPRRALPAVLLVPFLVVAMVVSSSACGTFRNLDSDRPIPYGGVVVDVEQVISVEPLKNPVILLLTPLMLIELGVSASLDTVSLPYTFLKLVDRLLHEPKEIKTQPKEIEAQPESWLHVGKP